MSFNVKKIDNSYKIHHRDSKFYPLNTNVTVTDNLVTIEGDSLITIGGDTIQIISSNQHEVLDHP